MTESFDYFDSCVESQTSSDTIGCLTPLSKDSSNEQVDNHSIPNAPSTIEAAGHSSNIPANRKVHAAGDMKFPDGNEVKTIRASDTSQALSALAALLPYEVSGTCRKGTAKALSGREFALCVEDYDSYPQAAG